MNKQRAKFEKPEDQKEKDKKKKGHVKTRMPREVWLRLQALKTAHEEAENAKKEAE